jgi:hypothetical protein
MVFECMCPRCGYVTNVVTNMKRHLLRKQACEATFCDVSQEESLNLLLAAQNDEGLHALCAKRHFECEDCSATFTTRQALHRHRKNQCGGSLVLREEVTKLRQEIKELQSRVVATDMSSSGGGSSFNVNSNNHVVTNNIVINAFGQESVDHITAPFLDQCVKRRDKGLVELIGKIHYDPVRAANVNMRITNRKDNVMMIHDGNRWIYERKDSVLKKLVDKGRAMMQEHLEDHEDRLKSMISETMFGYIQGWMDRMQEDDMRTVAKVIDSLYVLILNASMCSNVHVANQT